jgi:hypothetical protein
VNQISHTGIFNRGEEDIVGKCANDLGEGTMGHVGDPLQLHPIFSLGHNAVCGISRPAFHTENPIKDESKVDFAGPAITLV